MIMLPKTFENEIGKFYTDDKTSSEIADRIINRDLKEMWLGYCEDNQINTNGNDESIILKFFNECILKYRVCDPACGGGAFLEAAYCVISNFMKTLLSESASTDGALMDFFNLNILNFCLYGVDIDGDAVRACIDTLSSHYYNSDVLEGRVKQGDALFGACWAAIKKLPEVGDLPANEYNGDPLFELNQNSKPEAVLLFDLWLYIAVKNQRKETWRDDPVAAISNPLVWSYIIELFKETGKVKIYPTIREHVQKWAAAESSFHWELEFPEVFH